MARPKGLGNYAVHPHMRGENSFVDPKTPWNTGSPPHAWGKFNLIVGKRSIDRFTPTCVGKMASRGFVSGSGSVHPHMRGENDGSKVDAKAGAGSPPHAWGK